MHEELRRPSGPLLALLRKRCGSPEGMRLLLEATNAELGLNGRLIESRVLAGMALMKLGVDAARIARELSWQEFEDFCADILRASGFRVARGVMLKNPRRQIDIVADSSELILSIDCKHWKRTAGSSALLRFAGNQLSRSGALRGKARLGDAPIASVILTLTEETPRFVGGVAVVPVFMLRSFLNSFYDFRDSLSLL